MSVPPEDFDGGAEEDGCVDSDFDTVIVSHIAFDGTAPEMLPIRLTVESDDGLPPDLGARHARAQAIRTGGYQASSRLRDRSRRGS